MIWRASSANAAALTRNQQPATSNLLIFQSFDQRSSHCRFSRPDREDKKATARITGSRMSEI